MEFLVYMVYAIQHSDLTINSSISLVKKKKNVLCLQDSCSGVNLAHFGLICFIFKNLTKVEYRINANIC